MKEDKRGQGSPGHGRRLQREDRSRKRVSHRIVGEEHLRQWPWGEEVFGHILGSEWRLVCREQREDTSNRGRGQKR